jgi:hypothetical protein
MIAFAATLFCSVLTSSNNRTRRSPAPASSARPALQDIMRRLMATIEAVKLAARTTPSSDVMVSSPRPHGEERALARVSNHGARGPSFETRASWSASQDEDRAMRRLSFLDRCRGLFGRSRRQRGRGAGLLCLSVGTCGLGRRSGRAFAAGL